MVQNLSFLRKIETKTSHFAPPLSCASSKLLVLQHLRSSGSKMVFCGDGEISKRVFIHAHVVFFMACNAYLADITEPKHRTKRVAFMTGCFWIGYNSGKALSGVIKEELGFMYNFALGMLVSVLTSVYAMIFLKDSTLIREERLRREAAEDGKEDKIENKKLEMISKSKTLDKLKQLFSLQNVKAALK